MNDKYLTWLKDAQAMEENIAKMLEKQSNDLDEFPEMQEQVRKHLDVTNTHAESIKQIIGNKNGDTGIKSSLGKIMGSISGTLASTMDDSVLTYGIANYAVEHFEIAKYKALIETAKKVGDSESIPVFESILRDEKEMADWLEKNLNPTVENYINTLQA